ncbi:heterokaryon incompatibility protein-domain-containing protein [Phascolomyces articulosus]|uniref:Heterokaryon incompatibility protein-domain-containing protein n=1 Tax=Phascolomyces articulosus TaxID=60185 RepID=A0AAD5PHP3_9FUNG|nr:heterokaryon incompatibility protein-domain-containing protein [Phascolomyces articulosus]
MFFTYIRNKPSCDVEDATGQRLYAPDNKTGYRPTYLVRTSDWKRVPGEEAKGGYITLSYVWEQSGKIVKKEGYDDEYVCIDEPEHRIIHRTLLIPSSELRSPVLSFYQFFKPHRHSILQRPIQPFVSRVTFKQLLQQICKNYQIDYLWYDKMCIDQENKEEKLKELKQMHRIYGNARYCLVLVPEIGVHPRDISQLTLEPYCGNNGRWVAMKLQLKTSKWFQRSWTLEELMASKKIFILGTNVNLWQRSCLSVRNTPYCACDLEMIDFLGRANKSVNMVLAEAHFRTSTKEHDKIFALFNLYPELFDQMEFNYKSDVQETFINFIVPFLPIERNPGIESLEHRELKQAVSKFAYRGIPKGDDTLNMNRDEFLLVVEAAMNQTISGAVTHFHKNSNMLQSRALSLTEDCQECIILPILFTKFIPQHIPVTLYTGKEGEEFPKTTWSSGTFGHVYYFPVFKKCSTAPSIDMDSKKGKVAAAEQERYKAIGIMYLNEVNLEEELWDQDKVLRDWFGDINNEKEFIIE